jgi:hypothetical protein
MERGVLVRCPECGSQVKDPMDGRPTQCSECGASIPPSDEEPEEPSYPPTTHVEDTPAESTRDEDSLLTALRTIAHGLTLAAIFTLAAVVVVDAAILLWSAWPVGEAARIGLGTGVLFLVVPYPIGEAEWTGVGALALGCIVLIGGLFLLWVNHRGLYHGLAGVGTRIFALTTVLSGGLMLAYGAYLASTGHLTEAAKAGNWLPTPVGFLWMRTWMLAHWHGVLIGAILCSFGYMAAKDGPPLRRAFRRASQGGGMPTVRTDNGWILIFRIYLGMLFFYVVYYGILNYFTDPSVPAFEEEPLWRQLYIFAHASVWEEVLHRVLMLGLPLWLYYGLTQRAQPPVWRFFAGGSFRIDSATFTLIIIQGIIFALAHVSGWDFWKVLPTSLSGFFFGYLFLKRGLWAAIMLHFTFDYLGMTYEVIPGALFPIALLQFLWLGAGFVLFIHFMWIIIKEGPTMVRDALVGAPAPVDHAEGAPPRKAETPEGATGEPRRGPDEDPPGEMRPRPRGP